MNLKDVLTVAAFDRVVSSIKGHKPPEPVPPVHWLFGPAAPVFSSSKAACGACLASAKDDGFTYELLATTCPICVTSPEWQGAWAAREEQIDQDDEDEDEDGAHAVPTLVQMQADADRASKALFGAATLPADWLDGVAAEHVTLPVWPPGQLCELPRADVIMDFVSAARLGDRCYLCGHPRDAHREA